MSDRATVVEAVRARLTQALPVGPGEILGEDDSLHRIAGFDSLGILETIAWLESEFDLEIPDEDLDPARFATVGQIADYVLAASAGVPR
jgi:acyl carrier protein